MQPLRNAGLPRPVTSGSVDAPQQPGAAPVAPAATGSSGRSMFEARPKVEHLTTNDGKPNTTWSNMTASLGEAFDMRKAGRAVDTNLLYELSRHESGPMPQRVAVAELSAMGAIESKAFEQITNNTNFEGWKLPIEDRLAFAILMNNGGSPPLIEKFPMNSGKPTFDVVAGLIGKPAGGEWLAKARGQAKELLQAAEGNTLLSSPGFAALLRSQLPDGGAGLPKSISDSPRALLALNAATASGANLDHAKALAEKAGKGELDVVTLRTLAPTSKTGGSILFSEQFGQNALAPRLSLDDAAKIAGSVARGEIGFGQLHGFMMTFGAADDRPTAMLTVPLAAELVAGVNRGEISEAGLSKTLDAKTYFPGSLSNRIWDHFFSGKDANGGNKYTVSGIAPDSMYSAPFMLKLDAQVVRGLAASDDKREVFAKAFQETMAGGLPHGLGVLWDRVHSGGGDEVAEYAKLVDSAFAHARSAAGV